MKENRSVRLMLLLFFVLHVTSIYFVLAFFVDDFSTVFDLEQSVTVYRRMLLAYELCNEKIKKQNKTQ